MRFSVIIPAYNEEKRIGECLSALKNGSVQADEIIVADGRSEDRTREIARSYGIKVIDNPRRHAAGGRNAGIKASKGDVVVFLDADCIPDKDWMKNIKYAFEHENIDGLGTYIEPANRYEEFWGNLSLRILMVYGNEPYYLKEKELRRTFITASCAYKRKLLMKLKGFNNWFANNAEDIDICWRALDAGAKLKYEPKAKIVAHSPTELEGIKKKSFRNGYSSSKLQKVYGKFFNYDINIYKILGGSIIDCLKGKKNADLMVCETFWHLMGKYYGSFKTGIINI